MQQVAGAEPGSGDRPTWGRFNELQERGEYIVRDILEKASAKTTGRSADEQKIGDYYAPAWTKARSRRPAPSHCDHDLDSIAALKSKD